MSETKNFILFHHSRDIIIVTGVYGEIVEINRKAEAFLGYKSSELFHRDIATIISPGYRAKLKNCLTKLRADKKCCVCYLDLLLKNRLRFLTIAHGYGISNNGRPVQVCFFFRPPMFEKPLPEPAGHRDNETLLLITQTLALELNRLMREKLDHIDMLKDKLDAQTPSHACLKEIEKTTRQGVDTIKAMLQSLQAVQAGCPNGLKPDTRDKALD